MYFHWNTSYTSSTLLDTNHHNLKLTFTSFKIGQRVKRRLKIINLWLYFILGTVVLVISFGTFKIVFYTATFKLFKILVIFLFLVTGSSNHRKNYRLYNCGRKISRGGYPVNYVQKYEGRQLKKAKRGEGNK